MFLQKQSDSLEDMVYAHWVLLGVFPSAQPRVILSIQIMLAATAQYMAKSPDEETEFRSTCHNLKYSGMGTENRFLCPFVLYFITITQ